MKRSEMVNLMLEFEREAQEYKCGRQFMDNLLKRMEEAGMLPPPWWNIDYENNIEKFVENGSWEPESED